MFEEEIAIGSVVQACIGMVRERAAASGLKISLQIANDLPVILADERKVKQILLNLLSNAIKFTPSGGRVEVVATRDAKGDLELRVADTGIGIAPEDIPVASSAFGQVNGAFNRKHGEAASVCRYRRPSPFFTMAASISNPRPAPAPPSQSSFRQTA